MLSSSLLENANLLPDSRKLGIVDPKSTEVERERRREVTSLVLVLVLRGRFGSGRIERKGSGARRRAEDDDLPHARSRGFFLESEMKANFKKSTRLS